MRRIVCATAAISPTYLQPHPIQTQPAERQVAPVSSFGLPPSAHLGDPGYAYSATDLIGEGTPSGGAGNCGLSAHC